MVQYHSEVSQAGRGVWGEGYWSDIGHLYDDDVSSILYHREATTSADLNSGVGAIVGRKQYVFAAGT
jgi:hypothetical protein